MITVTVVHLKKRREWTATVRDEKQEGIASTISRFEVEYFPTSVKACKWGLKLAEAWRNELA